MHHYHASLTREPADLLTVAVPEPLGTFASAHDALFTAGQATLAARLTGSPKATNRVWPCTCAKYRKSTQAQEATAADLARTPCAIAESQHAEPMR